MTRPGGDDELAELFIGADIVLDEPGAPPDDAAEAATSVGPDR